jgi:glycosyltransferase involved in cell wall biosynthesis
VSENKHFVPLNKSNFPKVLTIVTVCLNDLSGLRATVDSVLMQNDVKFSNLQHIIVDGGSTDGTLEYLIELAASHSHVVYSSQTDGGVYDAMNRGLGSAEGRWVQFLNSGDAFSIPSALSVILRTMDDATGPVPKLFVTGAFIENDGFRDVIRNIPHNWLLHTFGVRPHCHQAMFFDTMLSKAIGGYSLDSSFAADFEFIVRVGLASQIVLVPQLLISYQGGGISYARKQEIPLLLHTLRARIFRMGRIAIKVDKTWVNILGFYRSFRSRKSAVREKEVIR